jgi:hypothetical protein
MSLAVLIHVLGDQALHHQQGLMRNSDSPVKWGEPREGIANLTGPDC